MPDFGHAAGFDFDLGRCAACGAYMIAVFYEPSTTYNIIPDALAKQLLTYQQEDPAKLKVALKNWVEG